MTFSQCVHGVYDEKMEAVYRKYSQNYSFKEDSESTLIAIGDNMHELGVVFQVIKMVEEVCEENDLTEISSVTLELGVESTVIEKYLYDGWKWAVLKKSEHMKDSKLIVETIPAITYCESCGAKYGTVKHGKICPECGSGHTYLLQGNEFNIKEIEGC